MARISAQAWRVCGLPTHSCTSLCACPALIPTQSKSWSEIPAQGRLPPPRHSHLSTFHNDHLYLYGGQDELGAQSFSM